MRKTLILGLGLLSSLLFIIPARYIYVCKIMGNCAPSSPIATDWSTTLRLMNGDSMILKGFDHFNFDKGSITPDLSLSNQDFLDKVAAYLKTDSTNHLTITGLYRNSEAGISSGIFENLGIARANAIRDFLVERGIDAKRITLDYSVSTNEDLKTPLSFELFEPTPEGYNEAGDLVKTQFRFDNMTFSDANFEFNSDVFKPGTAFNVWADSVLTYFNNNVDKSLTIIGHTDNLGTIQYNQDLGLRRAQSAKVFFEKARLKTTISTSTKGEKAPIAPNTTEIGRQKNRRVNFIIQ